MARKIDPASIPKDWKYDLLDNFAVRCSGHTPSQSHPEYWDGGIKWISLADSNRLDKGYIFTTSKEISEKGVKNSSAVLLPAETVVLSRDAGIGKSAIMYEPMAVSQHFIAWKCDNKQKLNSWFLYNWLQINKVEFERQAVGSTIKTIGLPYFKKLKIALPPYKEQDKIAQILSTWDQAISTTEKLLENSQKQKKALMQQLLTGKKRLLDEQKSFCDPWVNSKIRDMGKITSGGTPDTENLDYWNGTVPWLTPTDVTALKSAYVSSTSRKITELGVNESSATLLPKESLMVCTRATIGSMAISTVEMCTNQGFKNITPNKNFEVKFIYYLLSFNIKELLRKSSGSTFLELSKKDFENIELFCPAIKEQRKIAEVLSVVDQETETLQKKLDCLKREKKALMQQLLTGKKRVKVAAS